MKTKMWMLSAATLAALCCQAPARAQGQPVTTAPMVVSYDNCGTCCDDKGCRKGGLVGGIELVVLKPHFDHGNDSLSGFADSDVDEVTPLQLYENKWDLEATPRIWLGYVGTSGFGGRIRYWWFDHEAEQLLTGIPDFNGALNGEQNVLDANLKVKALDFEIMQATELGAMDLNISGGLRWGKAEIDRSRASSEDDPFDSHRFSNTDFEGVGPTLALEVRRQLGDSPLALIGIGRSSLLFGTTSLSSFNEEAEDDNNHLATMKEEDDVVYVLEVQLGAEFNREMRSGRVLFARVAWEAQLWGGAGFDGLVHKGGFPDPRPSFNIVEAQNTADSNISFIGFSLGAGIAY